MREKEKGRREALTIRSSLNLALGREAKLQGTWVIFSIDG